MGRLEGKVAVITGGSSGMALASAKRFVEEGAYVFITGRKQAALDEAVKTIGRNVTGVRGDAANLDDLDRLFDTVKREKGMIDVARTWLNELKSRNIRVNVLSPGPIATPMQDQVLDEEGKRQFESLIPRGRMGRPEEIATGALFLASDDSSFVNGVELSVDGGFSAI